ncbi:MAG TPA: HAD family hydrolase [Thermoleophilaceae bacterium]
MATNPQYEAVLFDLDGVLTSTAALHARAWKTVFDELLIEPFDIERDYLAHVDGKPRYDGVRDFMRSRGVELSEEQVRAIGDRKQALVDKALAGESVEAFPGSVRWVDHLLDEGVRTAVVSSSTNAEDVLRSARIHGLFETTVDGRVVAELGLNGKPAPDGFLEAGPPARGGARPRRGGRGRPRRRGGGPGRHVRARGRRGAQRCAGGPSRGRRRPGGRGPRGDAGMNLRERFAASETGWQLVEERFQPRFLHAHESVFAVANGYLGLRGNPEEGTPAREAGVALNGFYESWPIVYPEDAYGLARTGQTIVGAPDGTLIRLFVDDEPFELSTARLLAFERTLDMETGVLSRLLEFETARGHRMQIRSRRLASLEHRHLAAMDYEVVALDGSAEIAISSELLIHPEEEDSDDPRRGKRFAESTLAPVAARATDKRALLHHATRNSGLELASGMEHAIESTGAVAVEAHADSDHAEVVVLADLDAGESVRLPSTWRITGRAPMRTATWRRGWTARSTARPATATSGSRPTSAGT